MADFEVQEKDGKIYCPLKKAWHVSTPEERVRQYYIAILANKYGYSLEQMDQELKVNNSKRGQGKARADIVIWKSEQDKKDKKAAFIVVECKAENVKVRVEDYYQGFNYASWAHAEFFVTTNEKETKYFNVDPAYLPQKLDEVVAIPTAKDVDDAARIEQIKNQTKLFTRDEFTKTLRACHNIIRNNDKLSPEAAFDEISKLLFMKIRFERDNKGMKVFTKQEYLDAAQNHEKNVRPGLKGTDLYALSYMQFLFRTTKEFFKDDRLFDDKDEINIRENSFIQILEKLETFNLSDTQDDVKGIAFEEFLGTTFRGELGQFFTPRTIVDFMTEILDPQEGEVIYDPSTLVLPDYINILFMTPLVREQIAVMRRQGGGQYNLNSDEIGAIRIPVPPLPEQQAIIDFFNQTKDGSNNFYKKSHELKLKAASDFEKKIFS